MIKKHRQTDTLSADMCRNSTHVHLIIELKLLKFYYCYSSRYLLKYIKSENSKRVKLTPAHCLTAFSPAARPDAVEACWTQNGSTINVSNATACKQKHTASQTKGVPRRTHWMHVRPKEISYNNFLWSQLAQPLFKKLFRHFRV